MLAPRFPFYFGKFGMDMEDDLISGGPSSRVSVVVMSTPRDVLLSLCLSAATEIGIVPGSLVVDRLLSTNKDRVEFSHLKDQPNWKLAQIVITASPHAGRIYRR